MIYVYKKLRFATLFLISTDWSVNISHTGKYNITLDFLVNEIWRSRWRFCTLSISR